MFLSKITLNPEREGARKIVASPQVAHAAVMKSFSNEALDATSSAGRPLWRLETNGRDPKLFVLSPSLPDFSHIVEQAGRKNDEYGVLTKSYDRVFELATVGRAFRFKGKLNPVVEVKGKRVPMIREEAQKEWFASRAASLGFDLNLENFSVVEEKTISFKRQNNRVTLQAVTFEGILKVTDPELFSHTVRFGIGKAKAYGMGMITLA